MVAVELSELRPIGAYLFGVVVFVGYVESNLLNGEEIVYKARLHPIVYLPAIVVAVISLCIVVGGASSSITGTAMGIGFAGFVLAGVLGLFAYVDVLNAEFAVTNRRVLIKIGWLRRSSLELLLQKIEGIAVDQGIMGRILDFGTIGVRGTGGTRERFSNISAPLEFRRQIQSLIPD